MTDPGFRLYGFRAEDKEKIAGALYEFIRRGKSVAGILIELQDENRETLETVKSDFRLSYLLSSSRGRFAVHPSISCENFMLIIILLFQHGSFSDIIDAIICPMLLVS